MGFFSAGLGLNFVVYLGFAEGLFLVVLVFLYVNVCVM